jgi:nucleotide-binding universal stress UspA family protein
VGLVLRGLVSERSKAKQQAAIASAAPPTTVTKSQDTVFTYNPDAVTGTPMVCAIRGVGKTLDFAIEEARESHRPLYLLFVRSQPILTEADFKRKWQEDDEAREIFTRAKTKANGHPVFPCYAVSDSVADTIVDITATMGATHLILGAPERKGLVHLLRGSVVKQISDALPEDIHLLVYA